ncbi:Rho GTPase activation protein [Thelephora ganbajun]|uniref:Rho GTPase activation protein n=1 Tax=Thelephora ganbajun TaxID=370292 RepID=A0ACB6ZEK2_THEGA|nr:Rho GTPase activation protein [Thelephora ganbajun]
MTAAPTYDHYQPQSPAVLHAKNNLRTWWKQFTSVQRIKREAGEKKGLRPPHLPPTGQNVVFGKPLKESLKHASVQISTANANGELYVWGYIPVVVAKSGLYLKEQATEIEGTFRINGSNKRMRDLQAKFESPPRYGKDLNWKDEIFTPHDVASVFRRYLTQMPEAVIPFNMYHDFRNAIAKKPYHQEEVIATYKRLIRSMPRANQYLLLYLLDLLSVFARKSDKNLMTPANLAVIFRPAVLSHPDHEMQPQEHRLSQEVLEFLIAHQDWFMLDISPPPTTSAGLMASDEEPDAILSSDEDANGGSWKLVGNAQPSRIVRRRTTTEGHGSKSLHFDHYNNDLSPVAEAPGSPVRSVGGSIRRSRTLPNRRGTLETPEEPHRARVLRKQKRSSMQVQRNSQI